MILAPQKNKNEQLKQLILLIKSGDEEALKELFNLVKKEVFSYSLSILKNKDDAEDITQETFINIYNSSANYEDKGNAMPWILKITRNLCLMKIRRDKRKIEVDDDFFENISAVPLNLEEHITLKATFSILDEDETGIIYLHVISGFKHREISKIMNIPLSTVLSKYNRALKKLKKETMKGEEHEK